MAITTKGTQTNAKQQKGSNAVQTVQKDVKPLQAFFTKFNNDWCLNFSGALAYSLLMSMVPIAIAMLAILGFFLGTLDPQGQKTVIDNATKALPSVSGALITQAQYQLTKNAGILAGIAVILALFNGSRLFIQIEGFFGVIYHVRQRAIIAQNIMSFVMLFIFIVLIPIMTITAIGPSLVLTPVANNVPGGGLFLTLVGIVSGLIAAFFLFQAIYMIVPNQHISFRNSMPGAITAAIALQLYLVLFPYYVSHFLGSFATGPVSLIILLVFFYYFAVILLIGAEVNAFFAEKVQATPTDIPTLVHIVTSHLPKKQGDFETQAAASHKEEQTGSVGKKASKGEDTEKERHDVSDEQVEAITTAMQGYQDSKAPAATSKDKREGERDKSDKSGKDAKKAKKEPVKTTPSTSKPVVIAEAVAGTGLAFLLEWFRLRGRKSKSK